MIIELLDQVLLRLENIITKLDENGLLSMTRIARSRGESLEYCRRKYERQNVQPSSPVAKIVLGHPPATTCQGHDVCVIGFEDCDCFYGEGEID